MNDVLTSHQRHYSETAKPSVLGVRLANTIADCVGALVLWGFSRDRAERIVLEELEWRLFPVGDRAIEAAADGEEVIEAQMQSAPF